MEKKKLEKQRLFLSLVETMSLYKDSEKKKKRQGFMQEPLSLQQT